MLFSSIHEINSIYPTSRWDRLETLINPLLKVERTRLVKILGPSLLRQLNADYTALCIKEGGITALDIDDTATTVTIPSASSDDADSTRTLPLYVIDIIRASQEVILYITLSNNIRILSASLNRGGGFNRMETGDYDGADDKYLDALKRETWMNAMDSIEALLLALEEDARDQRIYTDLWKESAYYYQHNDLLFSTATDLSRYLPIENSRDKYISLLPAIRNAQDNYIISKVGQSIVDRIIDLTNPAEGTSTSQPSEAPSTERSDFNPSTAAGTSTSSTSSTPSTLNILIKHIKQALANYISASPEYNDIVGSKDNSIKTRSLAAATAHSNGDMQIALAARTMILNHEDYADYIPSSPSLLDMYRDEYGEEWGSATTDTTVPSGSTEGCCCPSMNSINNDEPHYSAIADFGGLHLS